MAHSKKELDMAGTERRVYDSFMREMRGYELANHDGFENSGVLVWGFIFPSFLMRKCLAKLERDILK